MANPYLAITVALGAALDGIRTGDEPSAPMDENLVAWDDDELSRMGVPSLPKTLGEALETFAADDVIRESLGNYIFDQLLTVKRAEWSDYRRHVSPGSTCAMAISNPRHRASLVTGTGMAPFSDRSLATTSVQDVLRRALPEGATVVAGRTGSSGK